MAIYNLQPITLTDVKGKFSIERELRNIGDVANANSAKTPEIVSLAAPAGTDRPGNPLFGYEAYADGVSWDPGADGLAGWFKRGPTAWERMTTG